MKKRRDCAKDSKSVLGSHPTTHALCARPMLIQARDKIRGVHVNQISNI